MKNTIVLVLGLLATPLFGAKPAYFKTVKGFVMTGIAGREKFELAPGMLENCNSHSIPEITSFDCDLTGTTAIVTPNKGGESKKFDLTHLHVMYMWAYKQPYREYLLKGQYSEDGVTSPVKVVLWHYNTTPSQIQGSITLENYGVTSGIAATATYPDEN